MLSYIRIPTIPTCTNMLHKRLKIKLYTIYTYTHIQADTRLTHTHTHTQTNTDKYTLFSHNSGVKRFSVIGSYV